MSLLVSKEAMAKVIRDQAERLCALCDEAERGGLTVYISDPMHDRLCSPKGWKWELRIRISDPPVPMKTY